MKIKIIGQSKEQKVLYVDGISSKSYPFKWDRDHGGYVYAPKSQREADDIFQAQNIDGLFFFAPILGEGDAGTFLRPPTVTPDLYSDLTGKELRDLAKSCEIRVTDADEDKMVRRLLEAYFIGQANPTEKQEESAPRSAPAKKKRTTRKRTKEPEPEPVSKEESVSKTESKPVSKEESKPKGETAPFEEDLPGMN